MCVSAKSKSAADSQAAVSALVRRLNRFHFRVTDVCADTEATFQAIAPYRASIGIECYAYPPYSACVKLERGK